LNSHVKHRIQTISNTNLAQNKVRNNDEPTNNAGSHKNMKHVSIRLQLRRMFCRLAFALLSIAMWPSTGFAQSVADFPTKPIKIIVPFPPGGSSDAVIRLLVPRLNEKLGQTVVIENRPGAGGNIGLAVVAKSAPDGYTLGLGAAGGLAANVSLYPQMPYDPTKDFKAISMLAGIPFVLVAHPGSAPKSIKDLLLQARAAPNKFSVGHGGNGTAMHLSSQLFAQMAAIQITDVPYKGSGPAAIDVLSGQIPLAMVDLTSALPHVKAGKLLALAASSSQRLPMLPDVPTMNEAGVNSYESTGWFGVVAPAGTPAAIINRLNAEIVAALNDPTIQNTMRAMGVEPAPSKPEDFDQYIKSEIQKWNKVIKTAGTKLD
jgi:tripartite-type tricarboxylate transporter receptor subunit TctC